MTVINGTLQDYKVSSVWEAIYGLKPEREQQLNTLAYLATRNDYTVNSLEIVAIYRDWSLSKAEHDANYPQSQVGVIPVPLWTEEKQLEYIRERINLHKTARNGYEFICTDEDRWHKPDKWAVMKEGRKSAVRLLDSEDEAVQYIADKGLDGKHSIEHRPGQDTRCENYCPVSKFCPQYQANPA